jgi:hypothetical protein
MRLNLLVEIFFLVNLLSNSVNILGNKNITTRRMAGELIISLGHNCKTINVAIKIALVLMDFTLSSCTLKYAPKLG